MTSSLLLILAAGAHANTAEGRQSPLIRRDLFGTAGFVVIPHSGGRKQLSTVSLPNRSWW
jgi:hypothetical protein